MNAKDDDEGDDYDDDGYRPQRNNVSTKKKKKPDEDFEQELNSQRELLAQERGDQETAKSKSVPTDKFYLELEKKFTIQNKQVYEKREQERLQQIFASQLRQKQKEELRYQISTPKTALLTHRFLRLIFLFVHGLNVGFQVWQTVVIWTLSTSQFKVDTTAYPSYVASTHSQYNASFFLFALYEKLTMAVQCISYFFVVICIVDTMDR